jgi:putative membrane protein
LLSKALTDIRIRFKHNLFVQGCVVWLIAFWILMAIYPRDRLDWVVENIPVFILVWVMVTTYRIFSFSDFSYLLITIYLSLHLIGAHYSYSYVPFGNWLKDFLHLSRNHYDRIVHFSFGLLMAYPLNELGIRLLNLKGWWSYYLPVETIMAFSAVYELIEGFVAFYVPPALGNAYLGMQGDLWDSQKDMFMALLGSIVCMAFISKLRKIISKTTVMSEQQATSSIASIQS